MTARCILLLAGTLACQALAGCDSRVPAPPDVRAEHAELVASLDKNAPGLAVLRLQEFARRRERYAPALGVQQDIGRWQALLEHAYRKARDLARDGAFDKAERILADLALVPAEPAGRLSRVFLAFEFHKLKASRLLVAGDADGAETAAGLNGTLTSLASDLESADAVPTEPQRRLLSESREGIDRAFSRWEAFRKRRLTGLFPPS